MRLAWALSLVVVSASMAACTTPIAGDETPSCTDADSDPQRSVDYVSQIRPLLWRRQNGAEYACIDCHTSRFVEGSTPAYLYLDTYDGLRRGGKTSGAQVLVPGKPCASLLVKKLRGTTPNGARMPRGGPYFTPEQVALVSDWIAEGAKGESEWESNDGGADAGPSLPVYPGY